jgi:hypothetical protein
MDIVHTFEVLDETYNDRQTLIANIKKAGKNYNFNKYNTAQLFRIWQRLQAPKPVLNKSIEEPAHEFDLDFEPTPEYYYCDFCGERLTDLGQCPVCELGEEDLG